MRIMAIDFGDARVGLAVSDELQMLTGDAWTLTEHNMERAADKIVAEAKARNVGQLVLGYPKNMDGSLGPRAEKSEELKALLEARCALPVALWDERRTSIAAHDILQRVCPQHHRIAENGSVLLHALDAPAHGRP